VADRSIPIELRRRRPSERVERFRLRKVGPEALPLQNAAAAWAEAHLKALAEAEPELPEELDDRAQDIIEPLLAIAEEVGGEWPVRARQAAVALLTGEHREDAESLGVQLLRDCRTAFNESGEDSLATDKLLGRLRAPEDVPWRALKGEPLDANRLALRLKPYSIRPKKIREGERTFRGYCRAWFEDAWARYLPADPEDPEQGEQPEHAAGRADSDVPLKSNVPEQGPDVEHKSPHQQQDVPRVPDVPPNPGGREYESGLAPVKCNHDCPGGKGCGLCDPDHPSDGTRTLRLPLNSTVPSDPVPASDGASRVTSAHPEQVSWETL
jgi:hypothetical protein